MKLPANLKLIVIWGLLLFFGIIIISQFFLKMREGIDDTIIQSPTPTATMAYQPVSLRGLSTQIQQIQSDISGILLQLPTPTPTILNSMIPTSTSTMVPTSTSTIIAVQ